MKNQLENILIFATNIKTQDDKQSIKEILDHNSEIYQWHIDQEDIDCVLRIETNTLTETEIIKLVNEQNFSCKILD
ncbi:hypothetical protein [Flavobacterium adhaerens]|uniref:hypothetical protein n=1 Tax=Flavobacterium adhaerens TaxID=3149043 RepID=UPI0032B604AD